MAPITLSASASASPVPSRLTNHPTRSNPSNLDPTSSTVNPPPPPPPPDDELTFLSLHFLRDQARQSISDAADSTSEANSISRALYNLEQELLKARRLPTGLDGHGNQIPLTYQQLVQKYGNISITYLRDLLHHYVPPRPMQVASLLSNGRFRIKLPGYPRPRKRDLSIIRKRERSTKSVLNLLHRLTTRVDPLPIDNLTYVLLPKSFRHLKRLVGHHLTIFTTLFDSRGQLAITGSDDHLIKIWSVQTGFLQHTLRGHDNDIIEIVRHPTRPIIVSASSDSTLRVWNVNTGAALYVLDGGSREVNTVTFSPCPDRPYLVSGGADGSVRLWNADNFESGYIRIPIPGRTSPSHTITDTRRTGHPGAATSNAAPSSPVNDQANRTIQAMSRIFLSTTTANPGPSSVSGRSNTTNPQNSQQFLSQTQRPQSEGFQTLPSPTSSDIPSRQAANSMVSGTPSYEVLSVVFNAGATRLAVSGSDCMAHVFAVEKDESSDSALPSIRFLTSLRGHTDNIIQVLFSRSGDSLITAGRDGIARIWRRTAARLPDTKKRGESVAGMGEWSSTLLDCRDRIQADAPSMLSGGATGSAGGSVVPRLRRQVYPVSLCAAMWSLDDRYVFTSSSDTRIRVWDAERGRLLRVLDEHSLEVYAMDCHPTNGRILLSAGYDGYCILWDIETGKILRKMPIPDENGELEAEDIPFPMRSRPRISDGQFSFDGLSFIVADTSGAINLFGTGSGEETALAPTQQFFSHDCAPYRRDQQMRAIDENTRQLLHLVPRGRLCDRNFRPHPPELQPQFAMSLPAKTSQDSTNMISNDHDQETRRGGIYAGPSGSNNQDKRHEALLLRAKEFRENQENEERRLLREAREARRRIIMEKNKAALKKDIEPSYLDGKIFEVPDTEYEDSDQDFDGENELSQSESSSSSSDEENEKAAHRRDMQRKEDCYQARRSLRAKRRSARRNQSSTKRLAESNSDSDNSDGGGNDDSPDYEAESNDSDSENSSDAPQPRGSVDEEGNRRRGRERHKRSRKMRFGRSEKSEIEAVAGKGADLIEKINQASNRNTSIHLEGSSIRPDSERMRIHIQKPTIVTNASNSNPPVEETNPSRALGNATTSEAVEGGRDTPKSRTEGNRAEPSRPFATTSLNPSFTSERQIAASVLQHRMNLPADSIIEHPTNHKTSVTKDPQHEQSKAIDIEPNQTNRDDERTQRIVDHREPSKRVRSESPIPRTRKKWRTRSRSRNLNEKAVDVPSPIVDIDELAEREIEILNEKRGKKRSKKRKWHGRYDEDEAEQDYDGSPRKRHRRRESEISRTRHGRAHHRRRTKRSDSADANEKVSMEGAKPLNGSAWLRSSRNPYTYVPQLGDDVMYFQQGHKTALEQAKSEGLELAVDETILRETGGQVLDGKVLGRNVGPLRVQIINITYHFTHSGEDSRTRSIGARSRSRRGPIRNQSKQTKTVLTLTLKPVHVTAQQQALADKYLLTYYPVDAPEYLVLTSRVEAALNRMWKINDRVRILFLNEQREWQYYNGTIRVVSPTIKTVIWNTVEVEYDNEEEKGRPNSENVSPWELEPQEGLLGARDQMFFAPVARASFEPGLFPLLARELEIHRSMEPSWRTHPPWLDSAEVLASSPGYCKTVPCPLDFNTVIVRVCTGYYRQFCSFLHDLSLLKNNAVGFHGAQSDHGLQAINFFTKLTDACERVRVQFLTSYAPILPAMHQAPPTGTSVPTGVRAIRPRPTPVEASAQVPLTPSNFGVPSGGRPFLPSMNHRIGNVGFAIPTFPISESGTNQNMMSSPPARVWNGARPYPSGFQAHTAYAGYGPGATLPPAAPGQANTSIGQRPNNRSARPGTRAQGNKQVTGQSRVTNIASPPLLHPTTSIATTSTSLPTAIPHHLLTPPVVMQPVVQGQMPVPPIITSTHTNNSRVRGPSSRRGAPTHALSQSRVAARSSTQAASTIPTGTRPGRPENTATGTSKIYTANGASSPVYDGGHIAGVGQSEGTSLPPHMPPTRQTNGDGATHSWGRSMEGAGGVPALQASTSDSHLPRSGTQGRSPSPISPTGAGIEALQSLLVHRGLSNLPSPAAADHEHSVISNAAAESTMSCGGAEVALQAGTAESEEAGTQRTSRRRR